MSETDTNASSSVAVETKPIQTSFKIPPAAELFPDTYDHAIDKTVIYICVLGPLYKSSDATFRENTDYITKALAECGYNTNTQLQQKRFSCENDLREFLDEVKRIDFFDCSAILLYWFGETDKNGSNGMITLTGISFDIRDLWKPFVEVDDLIGKPKINMFFTYLPPPSSIEPDSAKMIKKISKDPYETPREADVLILYQKTEIKKLQNYSSYVKSFANNMMLLGQQYHICNLASINTITDLDSQHYPIVVSTLTRKFYLQAGQHRGIHRELDNLTQGIQFNLDIMLQAGKKKPGRRQSANTAPSTRPQSKETLLSDKSLSQLARPVKTVVPVAQIEQVRSIQPRPRLASQSKSIESKPKWKNY